ncbi:MAG: riboflavin synthase [Porticoccaceae bacterium]|jgi:riboflavin synthase|nr:riboflavin synthase [Porticoccaceae bacterium]MBT3798772.1 riboflavin synthase [Porticoccaceae bacterium]MBT4164197.1 riboflavin synthase [Porticoccaceae bacterium]MBT4210264.1 riboflavin synthase [Porticoccaceae bacterium]MBT4591055.1 riboflavin synthase [Porticoccaceae bacterium]
MFTGIITAVGGVTNLEPRGGDVRLTINTGDLSLGDVGLGDSIACSGACLTAVELTGEGFIADVSVETLSLTTIGGWGVGTRVNLEKAMLASDRFGGHIVSGHVDGLGEVTAFYEDARSWRLRILAPRELAKYIAQKGSITVDGTSLTVNNVEGAEFELNIIPQTLIHTVIGQYDVGTQVNLEIDLVARYLERLLLGDKAAD